MNVESKSGPVRLTSVLTIGQVAEMAGWRRGRMWRHLVYLDTQLQGRLLHNVSRGKQRPRWTVTLAALQAIAPQWFHDPESLQTQLDELREQIAEFKIELRLLRRMIDMLSEKLVADRQGRAGLSVAR